ncbi:hypothetical protein [Candidatus Tisiphia endosymbiont of Nemotelus uliginosus]|uniref:hypothetical protein n=1 Tax=Candidatus Tisiphia endosymbiont of Nemotelus uliginosus TaxID=3077926 RepID=UPI0035C8A5A7
MSLNFIQDFQQLTYRLLSGDPNIRLQVDRIYLSVVQDAKYPFILINILKADNISTRRQDIYEIDLEICGFARDKNQAVLTLLADQITNKLVVSSYLPQHYSVASLKACNINFGRSLDLITGKMTINYKALLKGNETNYAREV